MKGIKAERIKVKIGNLWERPLLHVLLTEEDDVIVAAGALVPKGQVLSKGKTYGGIPVKELTKRQKE